MYINHKVLDTPMLFKNKKHVHFAFDTVKTGILMHKD